MRRRALLAAAAAALLARPGSARAQAREPAALRELIGLEEGAALAHRIAGTAPAEHEARHAAALRTLLAALGLRGPAAPADAAALDGPARRLAEAAGSRAALPAAVELETALVAACAGALPQLEGAGIVRTVATLLASHAQHRALLLRDAGRDPLA